MRLPFKSFYHVSKNKLLRTLKLSSTRNNIESYPTIQNNSTIVKMALTVHPITEEADFVELVRILNAAFSPERSTGMVALTAISQENTEDVESCISDHVQAWRTDQDAHYIKVIDTDLDGKMIAAASWRINKEERTEEQMQNLLPVPNKSELGNQAAVDFTWHLHHARKDFIGRKPFCCTLMRL